MFGQLLIDNTPRAEPRTGPQTRVRVAVARGQASFVGMFLDEHECTNLIPAQGFSTNWSLRRKKIGEIF